MQIIKKLQEADATDIKEVFIEIMKEYLNPSFGSISKKEFEILLFSKFQKLNVLKKNPDLFELVKELKVTRTKARNLIYESNLRQSDDKELFEELKKIIQNPIFLNFSDLKDCKIALEIQNPILMDYLRARLKELKYITDGSFSPELVKMPYKAFIALFESYLPDEEKKNQITKALVEIGATADKSFAGFMKGILIKLGSKLADEAGGKIAESAGDYLGPIFTGSIDAIRKKFLPIFKNEK